MKSDFKNYNIGKKLIAFSLFIAIISLFLPWGYSDNKAICGIIFGAYMLLLIFVYPLIVLFLNKKLNKIGAMSIPIIGIIVLIQIRTVEILKVEGTMIRPTGPGLYMFILSLVVLVIGINKYQVDPENNKNKDENKSL